MRSRSRTIRSALAILALAALATIGLASGCHREEPRRKLIVVGVDGLEWRLVQRFVAAGRMPTLADLLARGISGRLETLTPTHSPAIWTTIATGKRPEKHGIRDFAFKDDLGVPHLFTSVHRQSKALWNLLLDEQRTCDVLGWWCTFPVEEIDGVMVSQTSTRAQIDLEGGVRTWKGSYLRGIPGQIHPEEFKPTVDSIASRIYDDPTMPQRVFRAPSHPLTPLSQLLWNSVQGALDADLVYFDVAKELLSSGRASEVMLLYLGVTDVASHRFWRYFEPELFDHKPTAEEVADFGDVIEQSYAFADNVLAALKKLAPGADFVVLSDHGFHASNRKREFPDDAAAEKGPFTSGDHQDAPAGFFLACGPGFKSRKLTFAKDASVDSVPTVGRVEDVLPTLLTRLGVPFGEDMDGRPLRELVKEDVLRAAPANPVKSHEDAAWLQERAKARVHAAEIEHVFEKQLRRLDESERKRLRSLGYPVDDSDAPSDPPKDHH